MKRLFRRWRGLLTKSKRDMIIAHNDAITVILFLLFIYLLVEHGRGIVDMITTMWMI